MGHVALLLVSNSAYDKYPVTIGYLLNRYEPIGRGSY